MSKRSDRHAEIRQIADDISLSPATEEQIARLEILLKGDKDAQQFYYDYMSMHADLIAGAERNMQVIYRRITKTVTEEVILSPTDKQQSNQEAVASVEHQTPKEKQSNSVTFLGLLAFTAMLALAIFLWLSSASSTHYATILNGQVAIVEQGLQDGRHLGAGQYRAEQALEISLTNGNKIRFAAHSSFQIFNASLIELTQGSLAFTSVVADNLVIQSPSFNLHTNGSDLQLNLSKTQAELVSGKDTILLPKRWRPVHFWNFDSKADWVLDLANDAHGKAAKGASRTTGIVGSGAFSFDNSEHARIDVGSGGGTAPATGTFSVQDGITIEALLKSNYSGELNEIDEIFRKDQIDGELRILLSFQHDNWQKPFLRPQGEFAQSLSFGLYVVGQGYHELKLALDGQEGRPSLAQLREHAHHVVASYDVNSGLKAIHIDGKMLAHYQYPAGSKMLSGGPGKAAIGNNPAEHRWHEEAYAGLIDELAFYDFALPSFMINRHYQHSRQGNNYFDLPLQSEPLPSQIRISLPSNQIFKLDPLTGLPIAKLNN